MRRLGLLLATVATPVLAQSHDRHDHAPPAPAPSAPAPKPDPHAGHAMPTPPDHAAMEHDAPSPAPPAMPSPGPAIETAPPAAAGKGPSRAADDIWGADAMRASRRELAATHGDFAVWWVQADRLEARVADGEDTLLWDAQGYYGGPTRRLWFKTEGNAAIGGRVDHADVQLLYARAFAPFWDVQLGLRQDVAGPATTHAVLGVQGTAPYFVMVDAALFVSHRGEVTARVEAENDQRITQRLILQPRAEVLLAAQDSDRLGVAAGIDALSLGVRLRYEITREFAPYLGVEREWRPARRVPGTTSLVAGIRFWF